MKLTKTYLKSLIKESIQDAEAKAGQKVEEKGFVIPPNELRQIISHLTGKGSGPSHALAVLTQLLIKNSIVKNSDLYYGP